MSMPHEPHAAVVRSGRGLLESSYKTVLDCGSNSVHHIAARAGVSCQAVLVQLGSRTSMLAETTGQDPNRPAYRLGAVPNWSATRSTVP